MSLHARPLQKPPSRPTTQRLIQLPLLKFILISISASQNILGFYFIEVGKSSTISRSTSSKKQA